MKTSTILLALMSIASAELVVRQDANSTTTPAATITSVDTSPQATCLAACNPTDVNCRAGCVGGAHPNSAQVNQTYECITSCPKGDGSKSQTDQYNTCVANCITSHYLGSTVGPVPVGTGSASVSAQTTGTGASGSQTTGGAGAQSTSGAQPTGSQTSGSDASASGSAAPTTTSNSANGPILVSAGGLAGLFLAFFAL
ncbi:hypothetical protein ONS95_000424 [Cadophora gregata]|uniref:uncharacterized protein n=1 Tax=Cadophora gregata TaxID=51156 RepID=UPI0026DBA389|nr:uncharacterized protein ONS95_000424 [Cadophora gregata]KAK0128452.1 hypothetical protein ONS95_000424 [Cadophora gregata]